MGLTMKEKQAVTKQLALNYKRAGKKEKGKILDTVIELTRYDKEVVVALRKVWVICDCICGKRLGPYLPEIVPVLERLDELEVTDEVRRKLFEISPATIDRLLSPVRKRYQLRARSNTKPGTLLKHQIPIRTFSEWDEKRPLVCGDRPCVPRGR